MTADEVDVDGSGPRDHSPAAACTFDGPWFGASYPDAFCVDGYLHDADGDGYDPQDVSRPCPRCNTREYLTSQFDGAQGTVSLSWGTSLGMTTVTGDEIWEIAKRWSRQEAPSEADAIISQLEASAPGGSKASDVSEPVNTKDSP